MSSQQIVRTNLVAGIMLVVIGAMSCTQEKAPAPDKTTGVAVAPAPKAAPAPAPAPLPVVRQAPVPAPAAPAVANVAGTWKWTVDAGGDPIAHSAVLKQEGEKLTGTFIDGFDNTTVEIKEGKIHDGQVTLTVTRPFMDAGTMTFNFSGKLEGDTIKGTVNWSFGDQPMTAEWNAKRGS